MGDIADDMLNGLMCQVCGEFLDGEEPGYPRSCAGCSDDDDDDQPQPVRKKHMPEKRDIQWFKVHDAARLAQLREDLKSAPAYSAFTVNKRDKNGKAISFLGHANSTGYVEAHIAVWFANDALRDDAMKIIEAGKSAPGAA